MTNKEFIAQIVTDVYAFYSQDCTPFAINVWCNALAEYDDKAIADAFGRYAVNTENGQFCPKPADIVKMISGGTADSSLVAWAKVINAIRLVGGYRSIVFDDPLIHSCVVEVGGWIFLNNKTEDEIKFIQNNFCNLYKGYKQRSVTPEHQNVLVGLAEQQNAPHGLRIEPPALFGDKNKAKLVFETKTAQKALKHELTNEEFLMIKLCSK